MKEIFVAEFGRWGTFGLARVTAEEKPKTFVVKSKAELFGYVYCGNHILKSKSTWFETERDALLWLVGRAGRFVKNKEYQLEEARASLSELQERLDLL